MNVVILDMTNYWMFIVKDHVHMSKIILAPEILANRVSNRFWSLNSKTPNIRKLQKREIKSSSTLRTFHGRGRSSPAHPMTEEQRFYIIGSPSINFDYVVEFDEVKMCSSVITLDQLKDRMPLIL